MRGWEILKMDARLIVDKAGQGKPQPELLTEDEQIHPHTNIYKRIN